VIATNDTTLSADFTISSAASTGTYDLVILEPSGVKETLPAALIVQSSSGVDDPGITNGLSNLIVSPNPTNADVAISFELAAQRHVQLRLFDALGQCVGVLCDRKLEAGLQRFVWSTRVPNGTYVFELLAGTERRTGKIVIAK
jgi:hypothetical protein